MKIVPILLLSFSYFNVAAQKMGLYNSKNYTVKNKVVSVYTTADSTDFRISLTDKLTFKELLQPTEGEVSVFVEPNKTFQTFLGIGAALTDVDQGDLFAEW